MKLFITWLTIILIFLSLFGYQKISALGVGDRVVDWHYSDLRILDPLDVQDGVGDLLAVYTKFTNKFFDLRMDFYDLSLLDRFNISVDISYKPDSCLIIENCTGVVDWPGQQSDVRIQINSENRPILLDVSVKTVILPRMYIFRDEELDFLELSIDLSALPNFTTSQLMLKVTTSQSETSQIIDQTIQFHTNTPPPQTAGLVLLFWNAFRTDTPAQVLRSWDGAHSGLSRTRHGLKNLFDAVQNYQIPVTLLGADWSYLSAFDYLGVLPWIRELVDDGLLYVCGDRVVFWGYGYANNCFLREDFSDNPPPLFLPASDFSSEFRRSLFELVLSSNSRTPIVIGGDFSLSTWGNPSIASNVFEYLQSHPWIHILSIPKSGPHPLLLQLNSPSSNHQIRLPEDSTPHVPNSALGSPIPSGYSYQMIKDKLLSELASTHTLPDRLALISTLSITRPASEGITHLRAGYMNQIGHFLAAGDWANNPRKIETCEVDVDWDGQNECLITTENIFTSYELVGGYLVTAFVRINNTIHQIVAPTWQSTIPISDPSMWVIQYGPAGDPGQIPGIFSDPKYPWEHYQYQLSSQKLELRSSNSGLRKIFIITSTGIQAEFFSTEPQILKIPISLDPQIRFMPDWKDSYLLVPNRDGFLWQVKNLISINIRSSFALNPASFKDSIQLMSLPEDPNYEYPAGHFIPFPFLILASSPVNYLHLEVNINLNTDPKLQSPWSNYAVSRYPVIVQRICHPN